MNDLDAFFNDKLRDAPTTDVWGTWLDHWNVIRAKTTNSPLRYIRLRMGDERTAEGNSQDRDCWVDAVNLTIHWAAAGEDPNLAQR